MQESANPQEKAPHQEQSALLVSRNFPPLLGGMERLNQHLLEELALDYQTHLVGPMGSHGFAPTPERVSPCPTTPLFLFLFCATLKSVWVALRNRPALIMAGSGVNAFPAWAAAKLTGARLVIYLHGLDVVVDNVWYRILFLPIIRSAHAWLVNSNATKRACQAIGLDANRIHVLHPGVSLPGHLPSAEALANWRKKTNLGDRPLMLSVGRLTRRKGITEFIHHALPGIIEKMPDALLVIIGEEPAKALAAKSSMQEMQAVIRECRLDDHVRFLGKLPDAELSLAYAAAEVLVFPVLDIPGDMEGFGMVAIEAAAHGTPTVAFATGGVIDAVKPDHSGVLIDSGDYSAFRAYVLAYLKAGKTETSRRAAQAFAEAFSWQRFGQRLREYCQAMLTES